jgi:hypothetical protein
MITRRLRPVDQRKQAIRQFAAIMANYCTGIMGLIAINGDQIGLNPNTPVSCSGFGATTIGGLMAEMDSRLITLGAQSLADPAVVSAYEQIIACADGINNGIGIGPTCTGSALAARRGSQNILPEALDDDLVTLDLGRPMPNPFSETARLVYSVPSGSGERVDIGVYDLAGHLVRKLVGGLQPAGRHEAIWDARDAGGTPLQHGVYFFRIAIGSRQKVVRMIYLR